MSMMPESRIAALLDARSLALARRGRSRIAIGEKRSYLLCRAGGQPIGLALSEIGAVLADAPSTAIPAAPPALRGLVALSGAIVTVLDLAHALGLASEDEPSEPRHLIRLRGRNAAAALSVQRALGVCDVEIARIEPPGSAARPDRVAAEAASGEPLSPQAMIFGHEAVSGYAPRGSGAAIGIEGGFCLVDPGRLLRRFRP